MFSPYYAWSGWRDPANHCAMNAALYAVGRDRWAMTERGRADLARDDSSITVGPSAMRWDGEALHIDIDEWTAPLPSRLRASVVLRPLALADRIYQLDAQGRHHWRPIAPRARIDVRTNGIDGVWSGEAYWDSNWGDEPLQQGFRSWHWSRAHTTDGAYVYYDVTPRTGEATSLALKFDASGAASPVAAPPRQALPKTFWGVKRETRAEAGAALRLVRTLEDSPFYTRSSLVGDVGGAPADIMHESLSLDRFSNPVVRAMLPFRMPRLVRRR